MPTTCAQLKRDPHNSHIGSLLHPHSNCWLPETNCLPSYRGLVAKLKPSKSLPKGAGLGLGLEAWMSRFLPWPGRKSREVFSFFFLFWGGGGGFFFFFLRFFRGGGRRGRNPFCSESKGKQRDTVAISAYRRVRLGRWCVVCLKSVTEAEDFQRDAGSLLLLFKYLMERLAKRKEVEEDSTSSGV